MVDPRAEAQNALGARLQRSGETQRALEAYRQALEIAPDFPEAHNNIGTLLGALGRADQSISHFQRALAVRPDLIAARTNLALAFCLLDRLDEAAVQYRLALEHDPSNAQAWGHLGEVLLELGRIEEGRGYLERAISLAPRTGWFYRRWAETGRVRPGDARLAAMRSLADDIALPPADRMQLQFALAKSCDDAGAYTEAFRNAAGANAAMRATMTYDAAADLASLTRLQTVFTRAYLERMRGGGVPSPRPIFIVGMPRSGSTLIEQMLAAHPDVCGGGELEAFARALAEIPAFADNPAGTRQEDFTRLGNAYLRLLAGVDAAAARVTDKALNNVRHVGLIHLALPGARIVHVYRDPADACLSCFFQLFNGGQPFSYDLQELGAYYRAYRGLMRHWHDVLPPGAILDVRYEDVVADPASQMRRLLAFCGLEWNAACLEFYAAARPVRTASAVQVRRPIYQDAIGRSHRYRRELEPLEDAMRDDF